MQEGLMWTGAHRTPDGKVPPVAALRPDGLPRLGANGDAAPRAAADDSARRRFELGALDAIPALVDEEGDKTIRSGPSHPPAAPRPPQVVLPAGRSVPSATVVLDVSAMPPGAHGHAGPVRPQGHSVAPRPSRLMPQLSPSQGGTSGPNGQAAQASLGTDAQATQVFVPPADLVPSAPPVVSHPAPRPSRLMPVIASASEPAPRPSRLMPQIAAPAGREPTPLRPALSPQDLARPSRLMPQIPAPGSPSAVSHGAALREPTPLRPALLPQDLARPSRLMPAVSSPPVARPTPVSAPTPAAARPSRLMPQIAGPEPRAAEAAPAPPAPSVPFRPSRAMAQIAPPISALSTSLGAAADESATVEVDRLDLTALGVLSSAAGPTDSSAPLALSPEAARALEQLRGPLEKRQAEAPTAQHEAVALRKARPALPLWLFVLGLLSLGTLGLALYALRHPGPRPGAGPGATEGHDSRLAPSRGPW